MDHIAFLRKKSNLLQKILTREKTIESRWYQTRRAPWGKIAPGETVYFKNAGEPITAKAIVKEVLQIFPLDEKKSFELLLQYSSQIGFNKDKIKGHVNELCEKKYCILILLENAQPIPAFTINKKGFGNQAAWISVEHIRQIRST